jgi:hypothetical protein
VAQVDIEKATLMGTRFGIFTAPTIYLMREGMFYEFPFRRYQANNIEHIMKFALEEYSSVASNQGQIPVDVSSAMTKLWQMMQAEIEDTEGGLVSLLLMKDAETGKINYQMIVIVYGIPTMTIMGLIYIVCCKKKQSNNEVEPPKSEAIEGEPPST